MYLCTLIILQLLSIMAVIKWVYQRIALRVWKVWKRDRRWAFVTNIATVLHDHRCSMTAGSI